MIKVVPCDVLDAILQYVATLREQLEQLAEERTAEGLPRLVTSYSYIPQYA